MPRTNLSDQFDAVQRKEYKPKIVARNTFSFTRDGETVIRLHGTDIVRKLADGSVILDAGGWKTVTTKDRMNAHMPAGYHLAQAKGVWHVSKGAMWSGGESVPYFDGIRVPQCFERVSVQGAKCEKQELALRGSIKKFVNKLDKLECLPVPSSGDCWFCCLRDSAGKTMGDHSRAYPLRGGDHVDDNDHIVSHVKEGYLHGSLIWNALQWAGYRSPEFIWQLADVDLKRGKAPSQVKRALKRYLYRQLGLVA